MLLRDVQGLGEAERPTLPSALAAERLLTRQEGGWKAVAMSALSRAGILSLGMAIAGERENLVRNAVAGSVLIELFVIWEVSEQLKGRASFARGAET